MNDETRIPFRRTRGALTAIVTVLLLTVIVAGPPAAADQECTLGFEPGAVPAAGEMTTVTYAPSEEIMGVTGVTFPEDSGLGGTLGEEPMELEIDPADASAGEWVITLVAETTDVCSGPLTVTAAD